MSNASDLLDGAPVEPQAPQAAPSAADLLSTDDSGPAQESVRLSKDIQPQKAAQILKLKDQTGLPSDFVSRNSDVLQKQQENQDITPEFSKRHPILTSHIAEDPHHAALIGPDAKAWGIIERQFNYMGQQSAKGFLDAEHGIRALSQWAGYDDPGNNDRIKQIEMEMQYGLNQPAPGPISNVFGGLVETAPQMIMAMGSGSLSTLAKAPAAAAALSTAATWGALAIGKSFRDYSTRTDASGNPKMSVDVARGGALVSGAIQGGLFMLPVGKLKGVLPAGLRMLMPEGINSLIESPTLMKAMTKTLAQMGETGLTMGGFSGLSTLIHSASGRLGEMVSDGSIHSASPSEIISRAFPEEDVKAAIESGKEGFKGGAAIGAFTGVANNVSDYRNYSASMQAKELYYVNQALRASANADQWKGIGSIIASTQMNKVSPDQVEKLVSRMVPSNHVFVPLEQWQAYWEGQKNDPRAVFEETTGNTTSYDESLRTGADLQIPSAKYAAKISPSEHNDFFSLHLRSDPIAMSADDVGKSIEIKAEMEKESAKEKIGDAIAPPAEKAPEDTAIDDSHSVQGIAPLYPQPTAVGMSSDMAGKYREAIKEASLRTAIEMQDALVKKKERLLGKELSDIKEKISKQLMSDKDYRSLSVLQTGKLPDGAEVPIELQSFPGDKFKISKQDIQDRYPDEPILEGLPRGITTEREGIPLDLAASVLGYSSGDELLYKISNLPDREEKVNQMANEEMARRHGDLMDPATLSDLAMKAVHNADRSKVLRMELEHLASDDFAAFKGLARTIGRKVPTIEEVRTDAEATIGEKTTADTLPSLYQRAEAVASREAQEHFLRGDFEKAFEAKRAELLNHELYRAATKAREQSEKDMTFAQRFDNDPTRSRIGKAGADYLEQIDAIRERFDFSRTTLKDLSSRQSLRDWVQKQAEEGYSPSVPQDLLEQSNKRSWREMSNNELHSTVDAMRNIAHLASLKNKLLSSLKERTFEEATGSIVNALVNRYSITPEMLSKPYDLHPDFLTKIKGDLNSYGAWRTRMEPLFDQLGIKDVVFEPLNRAEDFKTSQMRDATVRMKDIFSSYSASERSKFGRLTYIPELEGSGLSPNLNKMEMLMTLLHAGNEGNMTEVMRGYRMTESQLRSIWSNLEPRDMALVQNVWDFVNSYWPQISKQERELNGLEPEKIEGRPLDVKLKDGSTHHLEGGYFPLVYDKDVSWRTAALGQDAMVKDMFPSYASNTATRHNWTQARVGGGGQAPSLKFSVLTNHVFDVIHDLSYRKPVIDIYKLLNDDSVRAHMEAGAGKGVYAQMNPWIKRIAGDRQWEPMGPFEAIRKVRSNMTVAELGIKLGSALVHTTSLFPATRELGMGYMAKGFRDFQNIPEATKFMWGKSEFMRSRWEDVGDRDIRSAAGSLNLVNTKNGFWEEMKAMSPVEQKDAWIIMRCADMAVAGPTWQGAYIKAMDGKVKGVEGGDEHGAVSYADQLVRDTKGSGAAKDLAPIQSVGGSFGKLLTMFYTQLNVIDNQMMGAYRQFRVDKNIGKLAGATVASWFMPAVTSQLLRGHSKNSDESWGEFGAKEIVKFPFELMPLTREALSFFERGKYEISPVEEAIATILKTAKNVATKNPIADKITGDDSEWTKKDYADAMLTLGYLKGLPTRQITQSAMRVHGWMSGEEHHDNPIGGFWSVATGAKPNE